MAQAAREALKYSKRIVIKVGSAVISRNDQLGLSLGRLGSIVEQVFELLQEQRQVIVVTSGAITVGRQQLRFYKNSRVSGTESPPLRPTSPTNGTSTSSNNNSNSSSTRSLASYNSRACAAAGQSGLMALYGNMFSQFDVLCSQILLTAQDFVDEERKGNLSKTLESLLSMGVVPIINENDVVSTHGVDTIDPPAFRDNDGLASLLAIAINADLLILLSDVDGVFTGPPREAGSLLLHSFNPATDFHKIRLTQNPTEGVGRGGMLAKVRAAQTAMEAGCPVVIANGFKQDSITDVIQGKRIGTIFSTLITSAPREQAVAARKASHILQALPSSTRADILKQIADSLEARAEEILQANQQDLAENKDTLAPALLKRLGLSQQSLHRLAEGIRSISEGEEPIGKVLRRTELAPGLQLEQVSVPLGVLLVIFESRPDALPQVAALAIRSGNALLLKGGSEARRSNAALHRIITDCLAPHVPRELIALIETREEIKDLLELDDVIDLVIPRGSSALVQSIQKTTRIPVMGHSEGICHVYVDSAADMEKAVRIVVDSKADYPAACNAMETLLVHKDLVQEGLPLLLAALRAAHVIAFAGPALRAALPHLELGDATSLRREYGDLQCAVELVACVDDAIAHVHAFGSAHTDAIVTEDPVAAERWVKGVDGACVFHNASTRFADGYRFGLGAEVGISTSRLHARGPVGIDGLVTTKWVLHGSGQAVAPFSRGDIAFSHKHLPL